MCNFPGTETGTGTGTDLRRRWSCFCSLCFEVHIYICHIKTYLALHYLKFCRTAVPKTRRSPRQKKAENANVKVVHRLMKTVKAAAIAAKHRLDFRRFQEMNAKLDKLLGLFVEIENLKTRSTVVESENKSLKEAMKFTNEDLEEVKTTSTSIGAITNKNTEHIESLERNFLSLKRRNIKLEAYTRRENIKIF